MFFFHFSGIISKLDYIVDLGVKAVWISPIYESPMKDFGYDISNFTSIDPIFGTLDDFKELSQKFKEKGKGFNCQKYLDITCRLMQRFRLFNSLNNSYFHNKLHLNARYFRY